SDRLFAEQAINLGYELFCVMPFPQAEYEKDFAEGQSLERDSLTRFRKLLTRAEHETRLTRLELDGDRSDEGGAYGVGGRVVLNQPAVLVVGGDGDRQGKRGGTEEIFDAARRRGTPVVWIDAHAPHHWQIVDADRPLATVPPDERSAPERETS